MIKEFEVTEDHIKLLQRMYVSYDEWTEFGAPEINPKRPYGNSDVYDDIAEILGIEFNDDDEDEKVIKFDKLHREMEHVLQILTSNLSIHPGLYRKTCEYDSLTWKPVGGGYVMKLSDE